MNNCGNSNNSGNKVKGYKNLEFQQQISKQKDTDKDQEDIISEYNLSDGYHVPRGTLVICPRNSSSSENLRFKSRYYKN